MGYVPYRDNPELAGVSDEDQQKISLLADSLELTSQQHQHEDRCACDPGRKKFWECIHGPLFPGVDPDEMLALAFARGLLTLPGVGGGGS
jgi:hypothetical protein